MNFFLRLSVALLIGQFHPADLVPRLSKGYENSGITGNIRLNVMIGMKCGYQRKYTLNFKNFFCHQPFGGHVWAIHYSSSIEFILLSEHTAFNCYQPNSEKPHVLNISCPSPTPEPHSLPVKGQGSKIKIVQGVYGISKSPGKVVC